MMVVMGVVRVEETTRGISSCDALHRRRKQNTYCSLLGKHWSAEVVKSGVAVGNERKKG